MANEPGVPISEVSKLFTNLGSLLDRAAFDGTVEPKSGELEDSWAWRSDAHNKKGEPRDKGRGYKFFQEHGADPGTGSPDTLRALGNLLFEKQAPEYQHLATLQKMLKDACDPEAPNGGKPFLDAAKCQEINDWLDANLAAGVKPRSLSHAQMVILWHVLVHQDDLLLLSPFDPKAHQKPW